LNFSPIFNPGERTEILNYIFKATAAMRFLTALTLYHLLLPLLFVIAFPGWIVKMWRRGGLRSRLAERAAIYTEPIDFEPCGAIHIHAVSVGEAMLAIKLIREWHRSEPERRFVLATGTATGHAVATAADIPGLRVTYAPLDFPWMVRRYLLRFEPAQIVLIEAEVWPHLLRACRKNTIPVRLVNARLSPRSARRYQKFGAWLRPLFRMLDAVAIQDPEDARIWQNLGVAPERIHQTGSLKFDPGSGTRPTQRPEFQNLIDQLGNQRPVILAASTHAGEESWIATAIRQAVPQALPVIVPRHAERRAEVKAELERAGFETVLRSAFAPPAAPASTCLVIDSTGELRDWTAHADVVVIGKSFLSTGGQNPCEAILAGKPVILGPHMENFQPLTSQLIAADGCLVASDSAGLSQAIITALDPPQASALTRNASAVLTRHESATLRIIDILKRP
jgi:3-deoxy-D-manno-octulosonic-acid transferase